jgi:pimeloyl-ACP methyl ester carboxylesterase
VASIATQLQDASSDDGGALARLGELLATADTFDPLPSDDPPIEVRQDIYQSVWPQAAELRASGELLELASRVHCPVVALHGDYDPHPAEGVREPLSRFVADFRFVILKDCGHTPWHERRAREEFYRVLESELATA